jgi:hypothetical protein
MTGSVPPVPFRLRSSRLKWTILMVLATAFVLGGIWIAPANASVGYSGIAFFGIGAIVAAVNLLPYSSYLLVDVDGFTFSSLFRKHFVPWSQVESFVLVRIKLTSMVGWNYIPQYRKAQTLRSVNTALAGAEAALPDTYGKSAAELIELLEHYRTTYGHTAL